MNRAIALFSGGRGAASIARSLLRTPGVDLSLLINGYDNGLSTGALRRYLPGMLGPSDFRKNMLLHLDPQDPRQAALRAILEHRLPADATRHGLRELVRSLTAPALSGPFAALPRTARAAIVRELTVLLDHLDDRPGLDLADCSLGNLVFAGAYLRLGEDFNAAVQACARTFGSPAMIMNITNGENAYLVALKENGRVLADEADIVAPQDPAAITDLFLLREALTPERARELESWPADLRRQALARAGAAVSPNPRACEALRNADLIVYGPGTPHSSLYPSYLTPGVADAIAASRATAKVLVVNIGEDHDVRGLGPDDLVRRTLRYLGDPDNQRRTVTHVVCHTSAPAHGSRVPGVRWVVADVADPEHPGRHHGERTVQVLNRIARDTMLARVG
jgi:Uncharacterized conserved protein